jgi:hypothetical protein
LSSILAEQDAIAREIARVLHPDGHLFLVAESNSEHPWRSVEIAQVYGRHLRLQQGLVWAKSIAIDGSTLPAPLRDVMHNRQIGHLLPTTSRRVVTPTHENIWHFSPTGRSRIAPDAEDVGVPYVYADQPARFGHHRQSHCRGSLWHIPHRTVQSNVDRDHHRRRFPSRSPSAACGSLIYHRIRSCSIRSPVPAQPCWRRRRWACPRSASRSIRRIALPRADGSVQAT